MNNHDRRGRSRLIAAQGDRLVLGIEGSKGFVDEHHVNAQAEVTADLFGGDKSC